MKIARIISAAVTALLLVMLPEISVAADDGSANPYAQLDPDGIPLAVVNGRKARAKTAAAMEDQQKAAAQAAAESNWLVRGYAEQLRLRDPGQKAANLDIYSHLSSNRDLAKLAGIPFNENAAEPGAEVRTGAKSDNTSALRPEAPDAKKSPFAFQPLITPLSSPGMVQTQTASSFLPIQMPSPFSPGNPAQPGPAPTSTYKPIGTGDSVDMQTPGMVASKSDPQSNSDYDIGLDVLPGETPAQAHERVDRNNKLQLDMPMNEEVFHKEQASVLKVQGNVPLVKAQTPAEPPIAKPVEVNPEDKPMQASQGAQITPVHRPIANPYDILNR